MSFLCKSSGEPMPPSPKPTKKVGFFSTLASLVVITCPCLFFFFGRGEPSDLKKSKSKDDKQLPKHQGGHYDHFFLRGKKCIYQLGGSWQSVKLERLFPLAALGDCLAKTNPHGALGFLNSNRWLGLCFSWGFSKASQGQHKRCNDSRFGKPEFPRGFGGKKTFQQNPLVNHHLGPAGCSSKLDDSSVDNKVPNKNPTPNLRLTQIQQHTPPWFEEACWRQQKSGFKNFVGTNINYSYFKYPIYK